MLKPLRSRILIQPCDEPDRSEGGILLPKEMRDRSAEGVVLEIGTGFTTKEGKTIPLETKVGDRILYDRCTVKEYVVDGVKHFLIREEDIMCVLEPDNELVGKDDCGCDCLCSHCGDTDEEVRETGKN